MAFTYITAAQVKAQLKVTSSANDALIATAVTDAMAAVNAYCHRQFEPATQTRYFGAFYPRLHGSALYLDDDLLTVTTLTNADTTVIPSGGYWLEPRNAPPYSVIRLKTSYYWTFNTDGEISVAGTWGYSATCPEDIARATLRWALYLYAQRDTPDFEVTATPDGGQQVIPHGVPADIKPLLVPYRRVQV